MTNVSAGSKRSLEGRLHGPESSSSCKRHRGRDEGRSWRDVHLPTPRDRRGKDGEDRWDHIPKERDWARERDTRRVSDYARERDQRDGRDRDREQDREKGYRRREDDRRDDRRRRTPAPHDKPSSALSNGQATTLQVQPDSDKEEGEITPRPSPRLRSASPSVLPSFSHSSSASSPPQRLGLSRPPQPVPEIDLELNTPDKEEALRKERRARRQAILAKYAGVASVSTQDVSPSPGPSSAVQPPPFISSISDLQSKPHSSPPSPGDLKGIVDYVTTENKTARKRDSASPEPEPDMFELAKDEEDAHTKAAGPDETGLQISAADYDPNLDRREDEQKLVFKDGPIDILEEVEEEDVDDMFAIGTTDGKVKNAKKAVKPIVAPALITTTLDYASDPEGYYQIILGEQLDGGRYQVFSSLGKGMFANVVRARVLQDAGESVREVAIKIIRSQESMYRAGLKEVQILNKLRQADPDDKKHIVRLERTFEHRGHLCLVFEPMSMNLRDVVKKFGKDVGLNIRAVRAYAHQLFLALSLLKKTNVMHADIKPDNILVNEQKTVLKLCDLGSASDASENEITPYLVSRFYRAPEIILGVPYDTALDMWSVGCTLYELYTGKILFPGRSNNQMLLLMMELRGRFNSKMIKKAKFGELYFDEMGGFESIETDRVTGANVTRKVHIQGAMRDLRARLMPPASVKLKDDETKLLTSFIDLLEKCLTLDPARRATPKEALVHPFIRG
ncbi:kinase-like domain-containing protein [Pisolithus croceorrhizus]|nr:kinase-like domain-containing protein [Pisolithus croceorrhizus]